MLFTSGAQIVSVVDGAVKESPQTSSRSLLYQPAGVQKNRRVMAEDGGLLEDELLLGADDDDSDQQSGLAGGQTWTDEEQLLLDESDILGLKEAGVAASADEGTEGDAGVPKKAVEDAATVSSQLDVSSADEELDFDDDEDVSASIRFD